MKIKLLVFLLLFVTFSWGQTTVTIGGGSSGTCPFLPTATYITPPTGVTFSNWSRGSGVTCLSASNGLSGSGFNTANAANSFTGNKYYSITITADATHTFTLSQILWKTAISSGTANFTIKYSNNGGPLTDFGTSAQTNSISNTFDGNVNVAANTSIILYFLPSGTAASGTTVRLLNGSTITLTASSACIPPSDPTGSISAIQNCNSTTLNFSNPAANLFWQTSATGTDFAYPTTATYNVTASGNYYVRAYNGSDCWSTGVVSHTTTVVNPVAISSMPANQTVGVGGSATFGVTATNVSGYQWQVNTGSGWVNIAGATSATYTMPSTTLAMNGYQYRVVLTNLCGSLNSSAGTLSVITTTIFKPGELIFVGFDATAEDAGGTCSGSDDKYYITSLVDINPGTEFLIVNSRYESGAASNVRTNKWYGSGSPTYEDPGVVKFTWNGSANIPAGSVITFKIGGSITSTIYDIKVNDLTTNDFSTTVSGSCNISSGDPDQIYLMQGSFTAFGVIGVSRYNTFNGKVLFGLTNGVGWIPFASAVSSGTGGGSTRQSRLPDDIECFNIELTSGEGIKYYRNNALHTGSKNALLSAIMNSSNWQTPSNTSCLNVTEDFSSPYTAVAVGQPFTITAGNPDGYWTGSDSTDWFSCKNWEGLYVPKNTTDVLISDKTNDPIIGASPIKYPSGAEVNNLEITSNGVLTMNTSNSFLNLYGNWTNNVGNAAFSEGNGTILFSGTTPQIINAVTPEGTETFYNVVLNNNFTTSVSNDLIANGDLTINASKTVTISSNDYVQVGKNVVNNGALTIQDDGSLVQVDDAGIYSGSGSNSLTRVAENLKLNDYVYWSSPQNNSLFATIPNSRYYEWVPDYANPIGYGYGNWFTPSGSSMTNGKGYIFRAPNGNPIQTVTFTGNLFNTGVITSQLKKGPYTSGIVIPPGVNGPITSTDDNWNLLGNPYPSAIDAIEFANDNSGVLENGEVSLWRHLTGISDTILSPYYQSFVYNYTSNDYVTYTASGSVPAGAFDGKIASGQAFFVRMKDDIAVPSTSNAVFNNSQRSRTHNNSQFFRTVNTTADVTTEKHRIWLDLVDSNNKATSQMVGYIDGATNADDFLYEAKSSLKSGFQFYSLIADKIYKIQGRQLPFDQNDTVPLGVIVPADGNYTIAINSVDGRFAEGNLKIYLEDKWTGVLHDLKVSPYQFNVAKGNYTNRFVLRYQEQTLSDENNVVNDTEVRVFIKNGFITISSEKEFINSYEVYNLLGQLLKTKVDNNASEVTVSDFNNKNQALLLKVRLNNGTVISKKIVF